MFDFIKNHAIENVWCTPDQDTQLIIEPARITPPTGALSTYRVLQKKIDLPDRISYWNLYQIGQLHPLIMGMFPKVGTWVSFAETCNAQKMICDIYVNTGIELPRFETFYMYTNDRDLIVAVKKNTRIPFDFVKDKIFIRVYSNEYFNSVESDAVIDKVVVAGKRIKVMQDIVDFQIQTLPLNSLSGLTYCFINGFKVTSIDLSNTFIGDVIEVVYDSSIIKTIDFNIQELSTFESALDAKIKYLLHYLGNDDTIQFYDDIDFFLIDKENGKERGVYFHKNNKDTVRMLTHRDYSIPVAYVLGYVNVLQAAISDNRVIDPENLILRLHVRKSGYNRAIIFENNRIKELYKMSDLDIERAMVGIDSVVDNWKAPILEASDYTKIMQSNYTGISNTMVQDAYGYNAMSKIIGDTPSKTYLQSSRQTVDVPYGLQNNSTMFEYDEMGLLLEHHFHPNGSVYSAVNPNTRLVEIISGYGTQILSDIFGKDNVPVPVKKDYRVYVCKIKSDAPDNIWRDVTDTDSYFVTTDGKIKWVDFTFDPYIRVRDTSNFVCYELNLQANLGTLNFSLNTFENREGVINEYIMQVPMGELDVFLNGKSLIPKLDYFINFPEIVIINKEYLINPLTDLQNIHVRFTGFCDSNLQMTKCTDVGLIEQSFLSNNNRFDIRDDKVLRIVVDGELKHRDDILFSEENSGISIINTINGKPYAIRDIVVPLNGLTNDNTYNLREKSILTDKAVSDYLSLKIPQPPRDALNAITARYQIFSPFICKIIYDLNIGVLNDPRILSNFSDNTVNDICKPYEHLLDFDPITEECAVDSNYVIIHPHNLFTVIELDFFGYRFVERVVKLYAKGLINLSAFLSIKPIAIP